MATGRQKGSEEASYRLTLRVLVDIQEAVAIMWSLAWRTDSRLWELIWHLDIEPLQREVEHYRALLGISANRRRNA